MSSVIAASVFCAVHTASAGIDTWVGNTDTNLGTAANWSPAATPSTGDSLIFGAAGSSGSGLFNNLTAGNAIDGLFFTGGSAFTINGNSILLSGTNVGNTGVTNTSGQTQILGLPLSLDWGNYTFTSPSGPSGNGIELNGGLSITTPGGVAYFDVNNSSSSLTVDGTTGLISGLEGNGLMYDGLSAPTALATLSGTNIVAYTATTPVASGAIGNGNNMELTATGATGTYTASGNTVNTLIVDQAGGAGGADFTTTVTVTGTLTLGQNGGVYLFNSTGTNHADLSLSGGTLTAGSSGPATINFCINGANDNNQATVSSTIVNNAGSGAVTVIKSGTGTMNFATTTTSSYTGGLYVNQGQLQFGQQAQIGTGPVYVASNATLYCTSGSALNFANNFFINPGNGAPDAAFQDGDAGAFIYTAGYTWSGTLTLLGQPVSYPTPGDRFTSEAAVNPSITGQITGTGTLEFTGAHTTTITLNNPNTSGPNANNWTGGVILDAPSGHAVNIDLKMGGNNQMGPGSVTLVTPEQDIYARFDLNATTQTIGGLNGASGQISNQVANFASSGAATLTLGANNASGNFTGSTSDSTSATLGFVKIGTGTQIFTGTSQLGFNSSFGYHGNTTVSNGTFQFTGSAIISNTPLITVAAPATLDASGTGPGGLSLGSAQTLAGLGTVVGSTTVGGIIHPFLGTIGALTNTSGTVTLNGAGTYVWDINNATGTAGADPGWSLFNIQGALQINATAGTPFNIDITSLTTGDVAGNAANFNVNANGSWIIASASGGISGFTGTSQFNIVTTAFSNAPSSSSQWSVSVSGNNLVLNYTAFNLITTPVADSTNNAGSIATFTVASTTGIHPITYTWYQNNNQLMNDGTSASGALVTISTNGGGSSSTLSIAGVEDADVAGGISVSVSDSASHSGSSSATLTVIDPPGSPSITQSGAMVDPNLTAFNAGGRTYLTAAVGSGGIDGVTPDFTYQWYLGTNEIIGATNATLAVDIAAGTAGNYTVVISNPAGNTSTSFSVSPVTSVPGQMIFEPFDSYVATLGFTQGSAPDLFSSGKGYTNLFNQITGEPAYWTVEGSAGNTQVSPNGLNNGAENQFGGEYPEAGLAGASTNEFYWTTTTVNNHLRITTNGASLFTPGGPYTNLYFSFTFSIVSLGSGSFDGTQSVFGGFCTSAGPSACGLEFWTWDLYGSDNGNQMEVGVGKGNGTTVNNPTSGVNINPPNVLWTGMNASPTGPNNNWVQQSIFVVGCYTVVDGAGGTNDTVSLWIDPPSNSFYAATAPTPTLGPTSFGGTVANSTPEDFVLLNDYAPASHRITDLRIGTTWASVTPPAQPAFLLGNVYAPVGTTATLASQNAGNPVLNYGWQFNGGAALTDGPTGHGSTISGSGTGTLVISNIQSADYGAYTINGTNTAFSPSLNGATLTGSTTALVTGEPPSLTAVRSGAEVVIQWPTNWLGYVLEQTPMAHPTSWTTNSLPPYSVSGTNNVVTVPVSGSEFYRLINP